MKDIKWKMSSESEDKDISSEELKDGRRWKERRRSMVYRGAPVISVVTVSW